MKKRSIPHTKLITALLLMSVVLFANSFSAHYFSIQLPTFFPSLFFFGLLLVAILDLLLMHRLPPIDIQRELPGNLAVDKWTSVAIQVRHQFNRPTKIRLFDGVNATCDVEGLPLTLELKPDNTSKSEYYLRPLERGPLELSPSHVEYSSPMGLWKIRCVCGHKTSVKVYPDFVAIANYAILATENHTSQIGIRKKQRRGEGMEFHQLREYRQGDSLRQLDWKATSRRQKLIARDYQDERDQHIVLMIDSGRRMRAKDDDLSHFDHALNATLLVSYIALRQGDNVSLMSFGNGAANQHRWIPPQKGTERVSVLLNGIYDLQTSQASADYITAAEKISALQPKRSLIILVTNSRDEDTSELLLAARLLKKRHLVIIANIREKILDDLEDTPVHSFDDALNYAGVSRFLHERQEAQKQLMSAGIYALDRTADQLAVNLANAYLEIKRSGIL